MKRFIFCIFIMSIFFIPIFTQEEAEPPSNSKIDGTAVFRPVRQGDKFIKVGLSLGVPLLILQLRNLRLSLIFGPAVISMHLSGTIF